MDNNPTVFPVGVRFGDREHIGGGLTIRDLFAIQIMGVLTSELVKIATDDGASLSASFPEMATGLATIAYHTADAMLEVREGSRS
jgi:hypothetical protein